MHANAADPSAISHFLKALGLSSSDLPALRFWTSGLTKEVYKCCWVQQALDVRHRGLTVVWVEVGATNFLHFTYILCIEEFCGQTIL
jgi:hypothetical protein